MPIRGGRTGSKYGGARRIFVPSMILLVCISSAMLLFNGRTAPLLQSVDVSKGQGSTHLHSYVARKFHRVLKSDPLKAEAELLFKQAYDNIALLNAYCGFARRAKLETGRQLRFFTEQAGIFTQLLNQPENKAFQGTSTSNINKEQLKRFERSVKEHTKVTKQVLMEAKDNFDNWMKIRKLKDTVFTVNSQLTRVKRQGAFANLIAAKSVPRSIHCLTSRLMDECISNQEKYKEDGQPAPQFEDPKLYHYAIFSDNVLAVSVVVNSTVTNAKEPRRHVFHIVTDKMNLLPMKVWFKMCPRRKAFVEVKAAEDFRFLNSSYNERKRADRAFGYTHNGSLLSHLRFHLAEMYPKLRRILFLEDDTVVQRDLTELWKMGMDGMVNAAVETCFGSFHRYHSYMNFSHPLLKQKLNLNTCTWAYGMNLFDLDAWRKAKCTEEYRYWQTMNGNGTLWKHGALLPPGLITYYKKTKPLDKSWHVLGLGYNPNIDLEKIKAAAVIHFNGNRKPWLDIAMNRYKKYWTRYVDYGMSYLEMCNFGH